jgi:long-chain-fatty-acid--[acyl-carrier-protein] ligase
MSTKSLLDKFKASRSDENEAVLLFTSGTESMPKGVPLTHQNILSNQRATLQGIEIFTNDILLGVLPPFHSFGFSISGIMPFLCGIRTAFYPDPTNGKHIANEIERWNATIMCGAPTFLKGMLKAAKPGQLKTLRLTVSGAEKAPPELIRLLATHSLEKTFVEGYGITECAPVLTMNQLNVPPKGVGKALPGVELSVVDIDTHERMPIEKQGLVLARGPNIFSGYLNKGLSSPFIQVNGKEWYNTGDLGYLDKEGYLYLSGRLKRFIKVGPEMISLASIEDALLEVAHEKSWTPEEEGPRLAICAKEFAGEKPKIFLFTKFPVSVEEVNKSLREAGFSNLVKVTNVQQLPEIPIMGTGKINYRLLESQYVTVNNNGKGAA